MEEKKRIERSNIDDYSRRNSNIDSYKNRAFSNKNTMLDEYTGKRIFRSGYENRVLKTVSVANTDHVKPIDKIIDQYGDNPFLSVQDLKEIANMDMNLAMTSEAINKSKGALENHEYLLRELKNNNKVDSKQAYNMLKKEVKANGSIAVEVSKRSGQYIVDNYIKNSARDTMLDTLNEGIRQIVAVSQGEKDAEKAMKDLAQFSGIKMGVKTVSYMYKDGMFDKILENFVQKGNSSALPSEQITQLFSHMQEIKCAIKATTSIAKYINGDISGEECGLELLQSGVGYLAFKIGAATGNPAVAIAASIACAIVCDAITEYRNITKVSEEKLEYMNKVVNRALKEMDQERAILEEMIRKEYGKWDVSFNKGFEEIRRATLANDAVGVSNGLNQIASAFGKCVAFSSYEVFDEFFMDEESILEF